MSKGTALITGASSGIGEATALALQKEGYQVYAAARRLERMEDLQARGIKTIRLDLTSEASVKATVTKIEKEAGPIDVLINNAGYGSYGALEDVALHEARQQIEVNLFGLAHLTQLVIPGMRKQKRGHIINISSVGGKFGEAFGVWYHASKYAVEGLSDSLALELAPFNIKVIVIEPGAIKTEWATIAGANLKKTSGKGPYAQQVKKRAKSMAGFDTSSFSSEPGVVAKGIVKVLSKEKPKFRYAIGGGAKPLMFIRKITSDRVFYRILNKILG